MAVASDGVNSFVIEDDSGSLCVTPPNQPPPVEHVTLWRDSRIRVDAQGTLIIQGVAPEDAGNYSCRAANEVGTDEETVTLYYTGTWASPPLSLPPSRP